MGKPTRYFAEGLFQESGLLNLAQRIVKQKTVFVSAHCLKQLFIVIFYAQTIIIINMEIQC